MTTQTTTALRTHSCGVLRTSDVGAAVRLAGWVDSNREHGEGLVFIDLRDRAGLTQLVFELESTTSEMVDPARKLRGEDVIAVEGVVRERLGGKNPRLETGDIEVVVQKLTILNKAESLPMRPTDKEGLPGEETRLRHRHIDLRRPRMQQILRTRHRVGQIMRAFLDNRGFSEIETPILFKTTPEGARDFLVPSRHHPGMFYALPQSPQILKQILMISGMDRYFQIVKCFRDEDLRADRQPEFTQLDIEMSFIEQEDVIELMSELFREMWREILGVEVGDIPRMTYHEAMERFGSDRPDLRYGLELVDISDIAQKTDFKVFTGALEKGGVVKAIRVPGGAKLTRKITDGYAEFVKQFGAGGLPVTKIENGAFATGVARFVEPVQKELMERLDCEEGDLIAFGADTRAVACRSLGELRIRIARDMEMVPAHGEQWKFLWVVDFPLVAWNEDEKRWDSMHHPFTAPTAEDLEKLETDPGSVLANAYDIVLNGSELGGGSVRIHSSDVQKRVFRLLGLGEEEARMKFGFFLDCLRHGAPPHGGIALGLDRIIMHLCDTDNIRDVIAFPKTQSGMDAMAGAPSEADAKQLDELFIKSTWTGEKQPG
ncbi:MAG: aspartate--tRNA ligase [Phycisphaeraceae bacterium]|nr:MAG: aspartate--tRNA ligase [Phycisphaeraceae bacterium]